MANVTHVSESDFSETVLQSEATVLVDFYADWCGPCKMIAPTLEQLATEFGDRLKVVKLDVDTAPSIAGEFGVQSIPTLIFFEGGKPKHKIVGALPAPALRAQVEKVLATPVA